MGGDNSTGTMEREGLGRVLERMLEHGRGNGSWRGQDPGRGQLNRSL